MISSECRAVLAMHEGGVCFCFCHKQKDTNYENTFTIVDVSVFSYSLTCMKGH